MGRVRGFILSRFGKHLLLIFLPFFFILSLLYILRISALSQQVTLTMGEFFTMFGYFLPEILFYSLPLSYVASAVLLFMKLSEENELIALFSFGVSPNKLIKVLIPATLLFSVLMLVISLYIMPQNKAKFNQLKTSKMTESKLSITPDRLGQKFGDYIVFVDDKKEDIYKNIVLFASGSGDKRVLIKADAGKIEKEGIEYALVLSKGGGDTFAQDKIESVEFEKMRIYSQVKNRSSSAFSSKGWANIWTNRHNMAQFIYNIFISISPILVLVLIAAFSIINPRYQKENIYLVGFGITIAIYSAASVLKKTGTPLALITIATVFVVMGAIFFHRLVRSRF